jgi:plastocyanin
MRKQITAISALTALVLLAAAPAVADQSSKTTASNTFSPSDITISPGEKVTFSNGDMGLHNVAWDDNGVPPAPSSPSFSWGTTVPSRTFSTPGVYRFYCQEHGGPGGVGMSGKVTVLNPNGTPPPGGTTDKTAPSLGKLTTTVGTKRFTLKFTSSEAGTAAGTIKKRNSKGQFKTFGSLSFGVKSGSNTRTIKKTSSGKSLTTGRFRVSFSVKDTVGNRSATKTATFTISR